MMKWLSALTETVAPITEQAVQQVEGIVELDPVAGNLTNLSLMEKGMLTTVGGLAGVFLVLTLFFITIKLMQKIGKKS